MGVLSYGRCSNPCKQKWIFENRSSKHMGKKIENRNKKENGKTMAEYFPSKKLLYQATRRAVSEQDRLFLFEKLSNAPSHCPMKWIISPEPVQIASKVLDNIRPVLIGDILEDLITGKQLFTSKCRVSAEQISWLAEETKEQRNCEMWGRLSKAPSDWQQFWGYTGCNYTTFNL